MEGSCKPSQAAMLKILNRHVHMGKRGRGLTPSAIIGGKGEIVPCRVVKFSLDVFKVPSRGLSRKCLCGITPEPLKFSVYVSLSKHFPSLPFIGSSIPESCLG